MRAIVQDRLGGPEVLHVAEVPDPEPGPDQIRVRVETAGVNPIDWKTRSGLGKALGEPPFILGWELAGVVDAVGSAVSGFAVGEPVLGMPGFPRPGGAYAEYAIGPARAFLRRPAELPVIEAGGLALAGLTAWQSLVDVAGLQAGQRLLVHAAAGGVGHLAVQIAKSLGAYVIGTASSAKHELLRSLGADELVDYRETAFEKAVEPVDVVYDLIGGETAVRSLDVLRPGGLLICLPTIAAAAAIEAAKGRDVRATGFVVDPNAEDLRSLVGLATSGRLRVLVAQTFPLEQAADAHRLLERGHTTGKIVLTV